MACRLCEEKEYKKREGQVRDNKELEIYECTNCGLVTYIYILNSLFQNWLKKLV